MYIYLVSVCTKHPQQDMLQSLNRSSTIVPIKIFEMAMVSAIYVSRCCLVCRLTIFGDFLDYLFCLPQRNSDVCIGLHVHVHVYLRTEALSKSKIIYLGFRRRRGYVLRLIVSFVFIFVSVYSYTAVQRAQLRINNKFALCCIVQFKSKQVHVRFVNLVYMQI